MTTRNLFVPYLIHTLRGNPFAVNHNSLWRAFEHVPNDNVSESTPETAYDAARTLGKFHSILATSRFKPSFQLPGFHDTRSILAKLERLSLLPENAEKAELAREDINFLLQEIPKFYLSQNEANQVIHGDPKLANFLFRDGRVIATLDLDTMMLSSPLIDLGDGFRSWTRKKPSTPEFKKEVFEAGVLGYRAGNPNYPITPDKVKQAMALITLELSARYLNDFFEENYFSLSPKYPSRREQGLTRSRRYKAFFDNFMNS